MPTTQETIAAGLMTAFWSCVFVVLVIALYG